MRPIALAVVVLVSLTSALLAADAQPSEKAYRIGNPNRGPRAQHHGPAPASTQ